MSKGVLHLINRVLPGLFYVYAILIFGAIGYPLFADAYLAEDKIYYSADSYSVNYEDEIITARGHAFFRKKDTTVYARKIVIHYAKQEKRAFLYGNVRVVNAMEKFTITGDYGEARYLEEYYFVQGNGKYRDSERTIEADKIESSEGKLYTFTGGVVYTDSSVRVSARTLRVDEQKRAYFRGDVHTLFQESGDEVFCDTIRYFSETGSSEFHGDVLYVQKKDENDHSLVVRSDMMRYSGESRLLVLVDHVFMMNGEYTVYAPLARYQDGVFNTVGDTIVIRGRDTIFCKGLIYAVDPGTVELTGSIRGIFVRRGIQ
jgi:lipopolysaccharide assembly outer membrane protein LptD (OstA)